MNRKGIVTVIRYTLLPLADTALFNLTFWIAYAVLPVFGHKPNFETYNEMALVTWLLPPVVFYFSGMYRSWDEYAFAKGLDGIITGVISSIVLLIGAIWISRGELQAITSFEEGTLNSPASMLVWGYPVRVIIVVLILAPAMLWIWRMIANSLEYNIIGWSAQQRSAIVIGRISPADMENLIHSKRPAYEIKGYFSDDVDDTDYSIPLLGPITKASEYIENQNIQDAFIVTPQLTHKDVLAITATCMENHTRPRLVLGIYEALISATQTRLQGNVPLFTCKTAGVYGWHYFAKTLIDTLLATVALIFVFPLIILPACILIVIESKGWPVFSQTRVGQYGRHFKVYKLRTMIVDADAKGGPLTADEDPRITRIGKFLRKTSIDELPQLLNVIKGEMSLVGPRAVIPFVADKFEDWERLSLIVKPGVTGLAQISGRDEIGFKEKSLLNLYYVRNHSIWLDLRILFDTVGVVLSMEGTGGTRGAKKDAAKDTEA